MLLELLRMALVVTCIEVIYHLAIKPLTKRREDQKAREFRARLVETSRRKFDRTV